MGKVLVYLTNAYPYGLGHDWKTNELEVLKDYFDKIVVLPFYYGNQYNPVDFIEGVRYEKPLFERSLLESSSIEKLTTILFSKRLFAYLKEGIKNIVFFSKPRLLAWVFSSFKIEKILNNPHFQKIINEFQDDNCLYYSYWGRDIIEALAFEPKIKGNSKISRFHGYDLYPERHAGNYLPYQELILNTIDLALPCSTDGAKHLRKLFPKAAAPIEVARLGTISMGVNPNSERSIFKIVSCSSVIPLKRVHLIAKAIKNTVFNIEWTHIGDGTEMSKLKEIVNDTLTNPNVSINLLGWKKPKEILHLYNSQPFHLFINVSEYEGVPVSIMEALASGIPILAPNVGGISEIIDEKVGVLLHPNFEQQELWQNIKKIKELPDNQYLYLRNQAYSRYNEKCNASENARLLATRLLSLYTQSI